MSYAGNRIQEISLASGLLITLISFLYAVNKAGYFGIAVEGDLLSRGFPFSYYLLWGGEEYTLFLWPTFILNIIFWSFVISIIIKLIPILKRK